MIIMRKITFGDGQKDGYEITRNFLSILETQVLNGEKPLRTFPSVVNATSQEMGAPEILLERINNMLLLHRYHEAG